MRADGSVWRPEFCNPTVQGSVCLNPQAARSIWPIAYLRTKMVMAGRSEAEIVSAIQAAFENRQLPNLESGAMAYMMSKSAYLTDEGDHNGPHLMFYTPVKDSKDWGAGAAGSPVVYGSRMLMKAPGFSALASIALALAIVTNLPSARAARIDFVQSLRSE